MITAKEILFSLITSMSSYNIHDAALHPEHSFCLALNVYHEARGESLAGKSAVAHVTLNRVFSEQYPNNICDVVKQAELRPSWKDPDELVPVKHRCQFSWFCDGRSDRVTLYMETEDGRVFTIEENMNSWRQSVEVSLMAMMGLTIDPTSGATHYFNHNLVFPEWGHRYDLTAVLGNHSFFRRTD